MSIDGGKMIDLTATYVRTYDTHLRRVLRAVDVRHFLPEVSPIWELKTFLK